MKLNRCRMEIFKIQYFSLMLWICATSIRAKFILPPEFSGTKIVGGQTVSINNYPYQAQVMRNGGFICGGSIVAPKYILSAAHCLKVTTASYTIRVGHNRTNSGGLLVGVSKIYRHPNYNSQITDYDAAIFRVSSSVLANAVARVIPILPANLELSANTGLIVSGWGAIKQSGSSALYLQAAVVYSVLWSTCRRAYSQLTDRMLCAAAPGRDR